MSFSTNNVDRGIDSAFRAIERYISGKSAEGSSISRGEVASIFGNASQYLNDNEQLSFADKAKVALQILTKDVTKPGITAVLEQLGLNPPDDPIIDPDPDPIVVRPRYGLMETARPIIDRLNAPGASDPEDIARAQILSRVAELAQGGGAPRVRGRAFALGPAVRTAGGASNEVADIKGQLDAAIFRSSISG